MRENGFIDIDLTGAVSTCSSYILGMNEESYASVLRVKVHPRFCNCVFLFQFKGESGEIYAPPFIDYSEVIEYRVPGVVMNAGNVVLLITAVDRSVGSSTIIFEKTFNVVPSISEEGFGEDEISLLERIENDISSLDERLTEVEQNGGGSGGGTPGEQAQADWSENDSESPSYVQNRTHYVENRTELINPEWDGDWESELAPVSIAEIEGLNIYKMTDRLEASDIASSIQAPDGSDDMGNGWVAYNYFSVIESSLSEETIPDFPFDISPIDIPLGLDLSRLYPEVREFFAPGNSLYTSYAKYYESYGMDIDDVEDGFSLAELFNMMLQQELMVIQKGDLRAFSVQISGFLEDFCDGFNPMFVVMMITAEGVYPFSEEGISLTPGLYFVCDENVAPLSLATYKKIDKGYLPEDKKSAEIEKKLNEHLSSEPVKLYTVKNGDRYELGPDLTDHAAYNWNNETGSYYGGDPEDFYPVVIIYQKYVGGLVRIHEDTAVYNNTLSSYGDRRLVFDSANRRYEVTDITVEINGSEMTFANIKPIEINEAVDDGERCWPVIITDNFSYVNYYQNRVPFVKLLDGEKLSKVREGRAGILFDGSTWERVRIYDDAVRFRRVGYDDSAGSHFGSLYEDNLYIFVGETFDTEWHEFDGNLDLGLGFTGISWRMLLDWGTYAIVDGNGKLVVGPDDLQEGAYYKINPIPYAAMERTAYNRVLNTDGQGNINGQYTEAVLRDGNIAKLIDNSVTEQGKRFRKLVYLEPQSDGSVNVVNEGERCKKNGEPNNFKAIYTDIDVSDNQKAFNFYRSITGGYFNSIDDILLTNIDNFTSSQIDMYLVCLSSAMSRQGYAIVPYSKYENYKNFFIGNVPLVNVYYDSNSDYVDLNDETFYSGVPYNFPRNLTWDEVFSNPDYEVTYWREKGSGGYEQVEAESKEELTANKLYLLRKHDYRYDVAVITDELVSGNTRILHYVVPRTGIVGEVNIGAVGMHWGVVSKDSLSAKDLYEAVKYILEVKNNE